MGLSAFSRANSSILSFLALLMNGNFRDFFKPWSAILQWIVRLVIGGWRVSCNAMIVSFGFFLTSRTTDRNVLFFNQFFSDSCFVDTLLSDDNPLRFSISNISNHPVERTAFRMISTQILSKQRERITKAHQTKCFESKWQYSTNRGVS